MIESFDLISNKTIINMENSIPPPELIDDDNDDQCTKTDNVNNDNDDNNTWSYKSLLELERDADRILDDIRNISSSSSSSSSIIRNKTNTSTYCMTPSLATTISNDTSSSSSTASLQDMTSVSKTIIDEQNRLSNGMERHNFDLDDDDDDDDEDSIIGEIQRLDMVTNTIRLSLDSKIKSTFGMFETTTDATNTENVLQPQEATPSSLSSLASNTKSEIIDTDTTTIQNKPIEVNTLVQKQQYNRIIFISLSLIMILWLWIIYNVMIIVTTTSPYHSSLHLLDKDGRIRMFLDL